MTEKKEKNYTTQLAIAFALSLVVLFGFYGSKIVEHKKRQEYIKAHPQKEFNHFRPGQRRFGPNGAAKPVGTKTKKNIK